jgi:hypothetical protein
MRFYVIPYEMNSSLKHFISGVGDIVDPSPVRFTAAPSRATIARETATYLRHGFQTATNETESKTGHANRDHCKGARKAS